MRIFSICTVSTNALTMDMPIRPGSFETMEPLLSMANITSRPLCRLSNSLAYACAEKAILRMKHRMIVPTLFRIGIFSFTWGDIFLWFVDFLPVFSFFSKLHELFYYNTHFPSIKNMHFFRKHFV